MAVQWSLVMTLNGHILQETRGKQVSQLMSEVADLIEEYDSADAMVAVQAAQSMCLRFREDVAIQDDLSVVLLRDAQRIVLEIVRYD